MRTGIQVPFRSLPREIQTEIAVLGPADAPGARFLLRYSARCSEDGVAGPSEVYLGLQMDFELLLQVPDGVAPRAFGFSMSVRKKPVVSGNDGTGRVVYGEMVQRCFEDFRHRWHQVYGFQ